MSHEIKTKDVGASSQYDCFVRKHFMSSIHIKSASRNAPSKDYFNLCVHICLGHNKLHLIKLPCQAVGYTYAYFSYSVIQKGHGSMTARHTMMLMLSLHTTVVWGQQLTLCQLLTLGMLFPIDLKY